MEILSFWPGQYTEGLWVTCGQHTNVHYKSTKSPPGWNRAISLKADTIRLRATIWSGPSPFPCQLARSWEHGGELTYHWIMALRRGSKSTYNWRDFSFTARWPSPPHESSHYHQGFTSISWWTQQIVTSLSVLTMNQEHYDYITRTLWWLYYTWPLRTLMINLLALVVLYWPWVLRQATMII